MKILIALGFLMGFFDVITTVADGGSCMYRNGSVQFCDKPRRDVLNMGSCLQGDFELQVQCRLERLMTFAELKRARATCYHLQDTLRTRWKDAAVSPIGSTVTGMATKISDTDCYASVPGYNSSLQAQQIEDITDILKQHPKLYSNIGLKIRHNRADTIHIYSFYDIVNQQHCEFSFDDDTSPSDSRMRAYYYNLDKRFLPLAALIKLWVTAKPDAMFSKRLRYSSELMVIFYLQQKKIAPPFNLLQQYSEDTHFVRWNSHFNKINYDTSSADTVYELLGGFFRYYSEFNFRDYVISPFIGRPVHRKLFENISTVPEEFAQYKSYLRSEGSIPLSINSTICIQEVFVQQRNSMVFYNDEKSLKFISDIKIASRMFDELPSHEFLKSIMSMHALPPQRSCKISVF